MVKYLVYCRKAVYWSIDDLLNSFQLYFLKLRMLVIKFYILYEIEIIIYEPRVESRT